MQHKVFTLFAVQRINDLFIIFGTQCGHHHGLCFATCKQGGTMSFWQQSNFCFNHANCLCVTSVNTRIAGQNGITHGAVFNFVEHFFINGQFNFFTFKQGFRFFTNSIQSCLTFQFVVDLVSIRNFVAQLFLDLGANRFIFGRFFLHFPRIFGAFFSERNDHINHWFQAFMTKFYSAQHDLFGQFLCFGFNHQHAFFCTSHNQIQFGVFHLLNIWV